MTTLSWRLLRVLTAIALAIALVSLHVSGQGRSAQRPVLIDGREAVDGEVLVRFRNGNTAYERGRTADDVEAAEVEAIGRDTHRLRSRLLSTRELIARLRDNPDVDIVEPNYIIRLGSAPSDPSFGNLWGLFNSGQNFPGDGLAGADIDATLAWDVSTGSRNNVVGIVDTGIDFNHPDLAANIWTAPSPFSVTIGGQVINCAAGTHGFNAITNSCNPMDDNNHGTHVAGTIGAVGNNGVGVTGVNWTASMMGLKFIDSTGTGTIANAIKAIEFAVQAKAVLGAAANVRVLSNSWAGEGYSQSLLDEINRTNTRDMLFVAAAGNSALNIDVTPIYPAAYPAANIITVAATTNLDQRASFSNFGATSVHLGAPGAAIISTTINNTYAAFNGTSMATPHVAGAAALLLSACSLTTSDLKAALLAGVDPVAAMAGITRTGGRLNVNNAIRACAPISVSVPNVVGLTQAAATTSLTAGDLTLGGVTLTTSSTVAAGLVISQNPNSGVSVARGTAVSLTVSLGPPVAQIAVSGDLSFGAVPVGSASARTMSIANTGNTALTVSSISYPSGFSGNWAGGTIPAGGSKEVAVTFAPAVATAYGGTVSVTGNQTGGTNTISVSGNGAASSTASATYLATDNTTQGTWRTTYGADGWALATVGTSNPAYGSVTTAGEASWVWAPSTAASQALQQPAGSDRVAATWYAGSNFTIDVNLTDAQPHQVALYAVDWDNGGRSQRIEVLDAATQAVLDTRTLTDFRTGQYWVWQVRGSVRFRITRLAGANAVISGVFLGGAGVSAPPDSSATFARADSTTQGSWRTTYGAEGWALAAVGTSNPAFATVTIAGESSWVWAPSTAAASALQQPAGSDRIAATWYSGTSFTIDVKVTDGQPHQVALYGLDWDNSGRSQRVDVLDAVTQTMLDTRTVSDFRTGQYWVWQVRGSVRFRITRLAGANAVISGVFFGGTGGGVPSQSSAAFTRTDSITQGAWREAYGADGWALATIGASNPVFGTVTTSGEASWVWASATTSAPALQQPFSSDRTAATWFAGTSFTIDVNLTDGQQHQVALYGLDWDLSGRSQRIDVMDAATDALLDTRTVSDFRTGQYWVWQVRGRVRFRITRLAGANAVISGVFVDP